DVIVVKGDLTDAGDEREFEDFLNAYGSLGDRMQWVRGNHDVKTDPHFADGYAPYAVHADGVTLAVVDTVIPGTDRGELSAEQIRWLDDLAGSLSTPVLVFGHHHLWNLEADHRSGTYFGINPDDSEALAAVVARRENIAGYFSGHTHRNRVRRFSSARDIPFVEIACTKDYPGAGGGVPRPGGGKHAGGAAGGGSRRDEVEREDPRDVRRAVPRLRARPPPRPLLHGALLAFSSRGVEMLNGVGVGREEVHPRS